LSGPPLVMSSATALGPRSPPLLSLCVIHHPNALRCPPPPSCCVLQHLIASRCLPPPLVASSAARLPRVFPPPFCCALHRLITSHCPPPTHLAFCPCLPTINGCAHCSNHRHRSLNLIVAFFPRRVTPTHHRHRPITIYRVLCPLFLLCCPLPDCLVSCPLSPSSCCGICLPPLVVSSAA
jgi:hypothetical protein